MDIDTPQWTDDKTDPGLEPGALAPTQNYREPAPSRLRSIGIWAFAIFCFFFFLMMKLPEARIQNLVTAYIRIYAQQQGLLFSAEKVKVGMLLGPSLKMYNVELKSIENERQTLKIAYLKISPRLLSLVRSVKKVGISAELLEGDISGSVGASTTGSMSLDLSFDSIDLGATSLLKKFLPVEVTGKVDGRIRLDLDGEKIQSSEGDIRLKLEKLQLPAQSLYGFNLPKINVSEGHIEVGVANGQINIKDVELGKDGKGDDIVGKLTGEGTLNRYFDRSTLNAKATFSLSQGIMSGIPLLGMVLGQAKQPDGKFAYRISGPLSALEAVPGQ